MYSKLLNKVSHKLFEPVDASSIVFVRVAFGLLIPWELSYYWPHIENMFLGSPVHFTYYGFGWVQPLPGVGLYYLFAIVGVLSILIALGLFYRIVTPLFFLGISYIFLLDMSFFLNHMYLVCLLGFLFIFIPCNRYFSLDALINPKLRTPFIPLWSLLLLRVQIGIPYFYGGLAKLNPDWLDGEPMRTWLPEFVSTPLLSQFLREEWVAYLFSYGGLSFDLLIVPLLLYRRTRPFAYTVAVMFHLTNAYIFKLGIFPWLMMAATLLFFPPDWPRQLLARVQRKESPLEHEAASLPEISPFYRLITTHGVILYLAFQLLMPFRQGLYPGSSSWTQEGYSLSWNMMLDAKRHKIVFNVTDPKSGRKREFPPERVRIKFMSDRQFRKMSSSPDMIIQFSHYLAERFREKGYPDVEVRARVHVSLNGRRPQLLIDPSVDLSKVKRRLWPPAPWILPLKQKYLAR
ncbi:MAG: HTTM domain-containing protein [bacterium]|nr:HTTM domain-containing protein [bacterium]